MCSMKCFLLLFLSLVKIFCHQIGHMPQEDYPEVLHDSVMLWLSGSPEDWTKVQNKSYKMSKKGMVSA